MSLVFQLQQCYHGQESDKNVRQVPAAVANFHCESEYNQADRVAQVGELVMVLFSSVQW